MRATLIFIALMLGLAACAAPAQPVAPTAAPVMPVIIEFYSDS